MTKKQCRTCGEIKPMLEYYKHKQMRDGHLNICQSCIKSNVEKLRIKKLQDPVWAAKEAERQRNKTMRRSLQFPEKVMAHQACKSLGKGNSKHLHHWSYLEEHRRNVFELDIKDHRTIHGKMIYDSERMMYRAVPDLELIDTAQKAKGFYEQILRKPVNLLE